MKKYIEWLCGRYELSLSELTEKLQYKSKTSLVRIMKENVRETTLKQFEKKVIAAFAPEGEELEKLKNTIRRATIGSEKFSERTEMWRFLSENFNQPSASGEEHFLLNLQGERTSLDARYGDCSELRFQLINSASAVFFADLKDLLEKKPEMTVEQVVFLPVSRSSRIIRYINAIMPLFYRNQYTAWTVPIEDDTWFDPGNIVLVSGLTADGEPFSDELLLNEETSCVAYEMKPHKTDFEQLLNPWRDKMIPLKQTYFTCTLFENYIQYCADYGTMEYNCAIWKLKPDVGMDYIPCEALYPAMKRGALASDPEFENVMSVLWNINGGRYENAFHKKQVAHTVMKRSAMTRFAETGRHSDHFWAMDAFTVDERLMILNNLLDNVKNNPYFHLHFLKDDQTLRDMEIACYEGKGFLMLESDTSYDLSLGHSELMLHCDQMEHEFRDFILNDLVPKYCISAMETVDYLKQLIRICEQQKTEKTDSIQS